jgi:hypothetical protein
MVDQGAQVSRLQLARSVRLLVCVAAVAVGWIVLTGATSARASETAPGRTLGGLTPALAATLGSTAPSTVHEVLRADGPKPRVRTVARTVSALTTGLSGLPGLRTTIHPPAGPGHHASRPQRCNYASHVTRSCIVAGVRRDDPAGVGPAGAVEPGSAEPRPAGVEPAGVVEPRPAGAEPAGVEPACAEPARSAGGGPAACHGPSPDARPRPPTAPVVRAGRSGRGRALRRSHGPGRDEPEHWRQLNRCGPARACPDPAAAGSGARARGRPAGSGRGRGRMVPRSSRRRVALAGRSRLRSSTQRRRPARAGISSPAPDPAPSLTGPGRPRCRCGP